MFLRIKKSSGHEYLQIVENKRDSKKTRQRVVGTIGRMDELAGRGQVDQLLRSLAKYSERALLLLAGTGDPQAEVRKVGPVLVFERLWDKSGISEIIRGLLKDRRYQLGGAGCVRDGTAPADELRVGSSSRTVDDRLPDYRR